MMGASTSSASAHTKPPIWMNVTSRELPGKGAANLGLFEHTISGHHGELLRVIEKRISNKNAAEILICNQLEKATKIGHYQALGPLPMVYRVEPLKTHTSIYMQHYQGCGKRIDDPRLYGEYLANSLRDLALTKLKLRAPNASLIETCDALRIVALSKPSLQQADYLKLHAKVIALSAQLIYPALDLPVVVSHNDLRKDNICMCQAKKTKRAKFIDVGLMAPNFAGADLRHLLRRSIKNDYWSQAYASALHNYALLMDCNPRLLSVSAHIYAMLKWLKVIKLAIEDQNHQDAIHEMYLQGVELYTSAKALRRHL